jgi:hypothetical protein
LWGLVTLGAVVEARSAGSNEISLAEFVTPRRGDLDRLLDTIRTIGGISPETMGIFEAQGGWADGRVVAIDEIAGELLIYSGFGEEYPPDLHDPVVLRRIVSAGTDLQLATLTHGVVGAAMAADSDATVAAGLVVDVIRMAAALVDDHDERVAADAFRLWRAIFVPGILRPDSASPASAKVSLRRYLHALERATIG